MTGQPDEQQRMQIEWTCEKLVRRFALYNDADDFDAMAGLFTEDAVFTRPTVPDKKITGREAILAAFRERPPLVIRHLTFNCVVDVVSATEATGISYVAFLASHDVEAERPVQAGGIMVGEYRDTFVLTDDGWRISERYGSVALKT